jgi:hypothetical protein
MEGMEGMENTEGIRQDSDEDMISLKRHLSMGGDL